MKIVDLFAGCGGMSLGFQNAGFEIVAAYENWKPAVEVYRKNFSHPIFEKDLSNQNIKEEIRNHNPDIIIGGPPCQDFSSAGKRDESLGRADLTISFADIVIHIKPQYFVMENVERITKSNTYPIVMEKFKNAGYALTQKVLDASHCGVPQRRKRFFLIGHLHGNDNFLSNLLEESLSTEPMSMYDYFGDSLGLEYYFRIPTGYHRRAVFSIHEPSTTIRGVDRPIPKTYKKHPGDPVDLKDNVRALTVKERSMVQTFPEDFTFEGTKTNLNQVIGNAVPVKLAEFIGNALKRHINETQGG